MNDRSKSRWFRFSLRSLFVVLTLVCLWLGYYGNWAWSRRAARPWIAAHDVSATYISLELSFVGDSPAPPTIPWSLQLFGEQPVGEIKVKRGDESKDEFSRELNRIRALFPEASVSDKSEP